MQLTDEQIGIFILDDDEELCIVYQMLLKSNGYKNVKYFTDYKELLKALTPNDHIFIIDYDLKQEKNGLEIIKEILLVNPHAKFIMLSGQSDKSVVVEFNNLHYGGRYIEKGGNADTFIIDSVRDLVANIGLVERIYTGLGKLKDCNDQMKTILHDET